MDKLKMSTPDLTDKNIEQIGALFPNVITETRDENGAVKKAVDFDLLRQMLSKNLVEDDNERYRLDWPGKKASLLKANTPITKTLRPCLKESSGKDGNPGKFDSENLYIEGDNFEVLKILQESYLGKIKMIYIDPPYNTGNDFIYKDNFAKSKDEYEEELGTTDEEGGKLFRNTDSNGRYHSDWLSMMYERLVVARDLLKDDGVIFISIDDNEVHNLRKICDEVFGEENFVANFLWKKKGTTSNVEGAQVSSLVDSTLCFKKSENAVIKPRIKEKEMRNYPHKDNDGFYRTTVIEKKDSGAYKRDTMKFEIIGHSPRVGKRWQIGEDTARELEKKDRFIWDGEKIVLKIYDFEDKDTTSARPNLLFDHGSTDSAASLIKELFEGKEELFDNPKPIELLKDLIIISTNPSDIILDFFSGSSTTAHAVMQLNSEDGGNRKFIMVQLPEPCDENSEAFKAGYKTIPEIGKERIRRAGKKILEEATTKNTKGTKKDEENNIFDNDTLSDVSSVSWLKNLDIGFRVYKTDSTNMKDVFYHPSELKQDQLDLLESNIKEDRTPEDLLTQVILDLGLELTLPIETKQILGNTVFIVQTNALVACFDKDIDFSIVDTISDLKPLKVVFKDASFKDDKDRINVEERFKRLSPETKVTVI